MSKTISLLVYEDAVLTAISGPLDVLMGTNELLRKSGRPEAFTIELVSEKEKDLRHFMPIRFLCHKTLKEVEQADLLIAPSFQGEPDPVLRKNLALVEWIREMKQKGAEVASLCRGSYFLAEAGLLSGKSCTSHWMAIDDMQRRYPDARILPDRVITDHDGIYTSGGAFSSIHLILYLIEKFCGKETAVSVSKLFSIDMDRVSQAHFALFNRQRDHGDPEILKAQDYIEQHYREITSLEEVASRVNMSRRNFIRRFKKATHNTPLEYLQRVRVEAAKKTLERGGSSISTLMYELGYSDPKSFRTIFRRITGMTPLEYRKKYSRKWIQ